MISDISSADRLLARRVISRLIKLFFLTIFLARIRIMILRGR